MHQSFISAAVGVLLVATATASIAPRQTNSSAPLATTKNGTLIGRHNAAYNQDFFLGIPYATPPLADLRFNNPIPYNETYESKDSTEYGKTCYGYGSDNWFYEPSEDCLSLNIVKPANSPDSALPVAVWIHGGGYYQGSSADRRYNLSFIVQNSVDIDKPIIGVSLNYRLSAWGFLAGKPMLDAGVTNVGLKDQRLALHWVQENIAAFGGDPTKVTIWGESAGGGSVGYHATAYGGRDDGLFRAVIAESLYDPPRGKDIDTQTAGFNNMSAAVGCSSSPDQLACLRGTSFEKLNAAFNASGLSAGRFPPVIDGDFIQDYSSVLLEAGKFTKTPLLIGANTDEGTAFGPRGISTDDQMKFIVAATGPDANTTDILLALYPDIPAIGIPRTIVGRPDASLGLQYKRSSAFAGDYVMHGPRRQRNMAWSDQGVKSYSYRFNTIPAGIPQYIGVTHFQEVAFVFNNTMGLGYGAPISTNPFQNVDASLHKLAILMSKMWVSFIHDLDPNNHGVSDTETWPAFNGTNGYGKGFVFDANVTSHAEEDTYRAEGIAFINSVQAEQFKK